MRVIGIDPGKEGAVAVIDRTENVLIVESLAGTSAKDFTQWITANTTVFLEKAQARPGQGVSSMFNYGTGFGRIIGWCEALMVRHVLVTPQSWTREIHRGTTSGDPKARSLEACSRLFPAVELRIGKRTKPHAGFVDALLIAEYGVRICHANL